MMATNPNTTITSATSSMLLRDTTASDDSSTGACDGSCNCLYDPFGGKRSSSSSNDQQQQQRRGRRKHTRNHEYDESANRNDADDVDISKEIANDMNGLTFEEREKANEDVHGVLQLNIEETPEFIQDCITKLDDYLTKMPLKEKRYLSKAFFLRPKYEVDTTFKLKFLRAEIYNIKKAAIRMCLYFEQKNVLFGEGFLIKDKITYDDLDLADRYVLNSGHIIELPSKDQIQRPVIFLDTSKVNWDTMESKSLSRAFWYIISSTCDDEIGQRKGICSVTYCSKEKTAIGGGGGGTGSKSNNNKSESSSNASMKWIMHAIKSGPVIAAMPFRYSSIHFVYDDPKFDILIRILRDVVTKDNRLRIRAHYGSELENEYKLMTFGIHAEGLLQSAKVGQLPILHHLLNTKYDIDKEFLDDKMKKQKLRLKEEEEMRRNNNNDNTNNNDNDNHNIMIIEYPQPNDVLIGRGQPHREHPGTIIWDKLIFQNVPKYMDSTNFEKTCLSMDMVSKIKSTGGRFLLRVIPSSSSSSSNTTTTNNTATKITTTTKNTTTTSSSSQGYDKEEGGGQQPCCCGWKILDDNVAREKAAIAFRSRSKALTKVQKSIKTFPSTTQQQQQQPPSSSFFDEATNTTNTFSDIPSATAAAVAADIDNHINKRSKDVLKFNFF